VNAEEGNLKHTSCRYSSFNKASFQNSRSALFNNKCCCQVV